MAKVFGFRKLGRSKAAAAETRSEGSKRRVDWMSAPDGRGAAATLDSGRAGQTPPRQPQPGASAAADGRRSSNEEPATIGCRELSCLVNAQYHISDRRTRTAEAWPTIALNVLLIVPGKCKYEQMCTTAAFPEERGAVTDRIQSDGIRFNIHTLASRKCHLEPQMRI
jgi:hypothetical protein